MKLSIIRNVGLALAASALSLSAWAASEPQKIEVPVESVMAPTMGFDDNDPIKFVVTSTLPNGCYDLGETVVERKPNGRIIEVRQFAVRRKDTVCTQGGTLPPHMQMTSSLPKDFELKDRLPAATYKFKYRSQLGAKAQFRMLRVASANTSSVDSLPYATTTRALTPTVVIQGRELDVRIAGELNSSCTELDEIRVQRENDVYVVLPTIRVRSGLCMQMKIPFERVVHLGRPEKIGQYLVHVRSKGGGSINQVVDVLR